MFQGLQRDVDIGDKINTSSQIMDNKNTKPPQRLPVRRFENVFREGNHLAIPFGYTAEREISRWVWIRPGASAWFG